MEFPNTTEGLIDKLIYFNDATVTKEEILGRLDALAVMEGEDRDKAVQDYFMELAIHVFHDVSKFRERASNDETLLKEGQVFPTMTAQSALVYVRDVFNKFFEDKGIKDYEGKEHLYFIWRDGSNDEVKDGYRGYEYRYQADVELRQHIISYHFHQ
jgi:hypothetical protein